MHFEYTAMTDHVTRVAFHSNGIEQNLQHLPCNLYYKETCMDEQKEKQTTFNISNNHIHS